MMKKINVILILIIGLGLSTLSYAVSPNTGKPPKEVGKAIMKGGDLVDEGEYQQAIEYLTPIIEKNPYYIRLHLLRGRAYFSIKPSQLDKAEDDFNIAVVLDPRHKEATDLVKNVREAREAQVSAKVLNYISLAWEGITDIIVIALGIITGMTFNGVFKGYFLQKKLAKLYALKNLDDYTDLIEQQIHITNYAPVRDSLKLCLQKDSKNSLVTIIKNHVDKAEHREIMLGMVNKLTKSVK